MPSWSDIQYWNDSPVIEAANNLTDSYHKFRAQADEAAAARNEIQSVGEAADSARDQLGTIIEHLSRVINDTAELMMATADAADGVNEVMTLVHECITQAQIDGVAIHANGSASHPPPPSTLPPDVYAIEAARNEAECQATIANINRAVQRATEVDSEYAHRTRAVAEGSYRNSESSSSTSPGLSDLPDPATWSPAEIATWWNALSEDEQDALIKNHPDLIGGLDGLPGSARDEANKIRLPAMLSEAEQAEKEARKKYLDAQERLGPSGFASLEYTEWQRAQEKLEDLRAVESTLNSDPELSLLVLDDSGERLKAAVAHGDIDSAKHVATFVPGMNTTVHDSLDSYTAKTDVMQSKALKNNNGDVATIAWLGYDAPDLSDVASTSKAHAGADRLNSFVEGIQASREAGEYGDPHQTVLGHSYGSTTSGMAVKDTRTGVVDDLVMFGSPGSGVQDIREYNLPADSGGDPGPHAHVSHAQYRDRVQGIGPDFSFGKNPNKLDGIEHLADSTAKPDTFWEWVDPFSQHSSYFEEGSATMNDFGRVIAGVK